jgi:hypothetical protein
MQQVYLQERQQYLQWWIIAKAWVYYELLKQRLLSRLLAPGPTSAATAQARKLNVLAFSE